LIELCTQPFIGPTDKTLRVLKVLDRTAVATVQREKLRAGAMYCNHVPSQARGFSEFIPDVDVTRIGEALSFEDCLRFSVAVV